MSHGDGLINSYQGSESNVVDYFPAVVRIVAKDFPDNVMSTPEDTDNALRNMWVKKYLRTPQPVDNPYISKPNAFETGNSAWAIE